MAPLKPVCRENHDATLEKRLPTRADGTLKQGLACLSSEREEE